MQHTKIMFIIAVAVFLSASAEEQAAEPANLMRNHSFAVVNDAGEPAGWSFQVKNLDGTKPAGGAMTCVVAASADEPTRNVLQLTLDLAEQRIKIYPGTLARQVAIPKLEAAAEYRFSARVKWDEATAATGKGQGKAPLYFVAGKDTQITIASGGGWREVTFSVQVPAGGRELPVRIQGARLVGTLSFADLAVVAVGK
jgi:hypothetical protein